MATRCIRARSPEEAYNGLLAFNPQLVTIDVDHVLTPYGGDEVLAQSRTLVQHLGQASIARVGASNTSSVERLPAISSQLDGIPILHPQAAGGLRRKPHPSMLQRACQITGVEPERAVHIDDQYFKGYGAARRAGFAAHIWLRPQASILRDHPGTYPVRLFELLPLCIIYLAQSNIFPPDNLQ